MNRTVVALGAVLGGALLLFAVAVALSAPAAPRALFTAPLPVPLVIAHQGGDGLRPGNTLAAFENAVRLRVDMLEMDVQSTADGALVLMHDSTVDRTTDGSGAVASFSLAELQQLDAAYDWSADGGQSNPFRGTDVRVPALQEVLAAFPEMRMIIEIKQEAPALGMPLCTLLAAHNMQQKVLVAAFSAVAIADFRKACPQVATAASQREVVTFYLLNLVFVGAAYSPPFSALQVPERRSGLQLITPSFASTAHLKQLHLHVWTVNETDDMRRMIDAGVDGIITDYPDRLLALLNR
ncbi:MAG: glycerophosphodiester phosphodiesterase [Chloroflexi bacterium]|nr:MAG: glycerophosphodiester phosphodiesterase [Chloroflexota bacterium]RLT46856.1 MAG: glycerophosphodiester phosphodiesterase [Chloroflexota bacterium]